MLRLGIVLVLVWIMSVCTLAQWHQPVFSDLEGDSLIEMLRQTYKSNQNLTYAQARDTLYGKILNKADSLACIYTSYTIYLDPAENPRQDAFQKGLNAEHIWPRSLGASSTLAEADMHNLYSCRTDVNSDRGNLPFLELTDNQTQIWYYRDIKTSTRPIIDKEKYSRLGQGRFTPANHRKGDVARSMLYFYTMYESADNAFFELQRDDLCRWHIEDPVDEEEWNKTWGIAPYQEGKPNPYILDCTLAQRTYCGHLNLECDVSSSVDPVMKLDDFVAAVSPNPVTTAGPFAYEIFLNRQAEVSLVWIDMFGRILGHFELGILDHGHHRIELPSDKIPLIPGAYLLQTKIANTQQTSTRIQKVIVK